MSEARLALIGDGDGDGDGLFPCPPAPTGAHEPLAPASPASPAAADGDGRAVDAVDADHQKCADCGEYKRLLSKDLPWPPGKVLRCCEVPYLRRKCGAETRKRKRNEAVLEQLQKERALEEDRALEKARRHGGMVIVRDAAAPHKTKFKRFYGDPRAGMSDAEKRRLLKELAAFEAGIGLAGPSLLLLQQQPVCWCVSCRKPRRLRQGAHAWPEDVPFLCISAGGDDCRPAHDRVDVPCYMECRTVGCHRHVQVPKDKDPWETPHRPFYCCDAGLSCRVQFWPEWR